MPPKQKVTFEATLELEAGNAAMVDLGKMLGPTGVNTRGVKVEYDEATSASRGDIVPVVITVFEDRSYKLRYKTPPTSFLIRKELGLKSGAEAPGRGKNAGSMSQDQLRSIAERKMQDLNANSVEAAMQVVAGSARSMGVAVSDK
ncbi:MAG: uL11 family ribosomal protein [Sciscionella sp.]